MSRSHPTKESGASQDERREWAEACFRIERIEKITARLSDYLLRQGGLGPESWSLVMEALNLHDAMARALAHRKERHLHQHLATEAVRKCKTAATKKLRRRR